jgi:hypothetical protein
MAVRRLVRPTHVRHIYAKLDANSRSEAVGGLGFFAPAWRMRWGTRAAGARQLRRRAMPAERARLDEQRLLLVVVQRRRTAAPPGAAGSGIRPPALRSGPLVDQASA